MVTRIADDRFPIYHFNKELEEIYFRIDTDDTYNIVLVPLGATTRSFPPCSIVIAIKDLDQFTPLYAIKPGQCVRVRKVKHKNLFPFNVHLNRVLIVTLIFFSQKTVTEWLK
jgi:hypothetical protein